MRYRPDDAELLDAVAALLEEDVLPETAGALQHKVRVAANLVRILQRQAELEPAASARERTALASLLSASDDDLGHLRTELDRRLRAGDQNLDQGQVWEVLVATARDDLAMAKPGYDAWEGE